MDNKLYPASPEVEAEALSWLAQLDGDSVTEKDLEALRDWMDRSPAHVRALKRLNSLWSDLNVLTDMVLPIAQTDKVSQQLRSADKRHARRKRLLVPAFIGAVCAVLAVSVQYFPSALSETLETAMVQRPVILKTQIGEQNSREMSDGSVITLNTDSHIEVDYLDNQRRIRLLKGEAFFDVAHDASRPFIVYAGDGIVQAVGTAFTVRLKEQNVDVLVSEGAVELSSFVQMPDTGAGDVHPNEIVSLAIIKSGHKANFSHAKAAIVAVSESEMSASLSWQHGLLTFSGQTLEDVIQEVSRYTPLDIQIVHPDLKVLRLGGVFLSGDMESLFNTLEVNFDVRVDDATPGLVRLDKN